MQACLLLAGLALSAAYTPPRRLRGNNTAMLEISPELRRRLHDLEMFQGTVKASKHAHWHVTIRQLVQHPKVDLSGSIHLSPDGSRWSLKEISTYASYVYQLHNAKTVADREALQKQWSNTTLHGRVNLWDLLQLLHFTVDHTDMLLKYTSQLVHCIQAYEMVLATDFPQPEYDASYKRDMAITALVHDVGKLLSVYGEHDSNVDCMNKVIPDSYVDQVGLEYINVMWNHDEFGYQKLRGMQRLPERVLGAIRFHSLREVTSPSRHVSRAEADAFYAHLTQHEKDHVLPFVRHFRHFDQASKRRTDLIPAVNLDGLFDIMDDYFPDLSIQW